MAEKIDLIGKDYRAVAMENACRIAEYYASDISNIPHRLVAIAKLTSLLYRTMTQDSEINAELIQAMFDKE